MVANEEKVVDRPKKAKKEDKERENIKVKEARPVKPMNIFGQIMNNPNFNLQLMVILLSLTSEDMQMDRRIDGMTTTIDKVRNITELVNNGKNSMKMVSEFPKSIRRILE
ncbi:MAG: hypothetical protein K0R78_2030 [Pelosinus sp.]|nr:hypothetical protein [Pelosinus sp.]